MSAAPVDPEAVLSTPRLRMEPLRGAHAAELFPLLADPRLYHFIPQDPPATVAALEQRYARLERRSSDDGTQVWLNWALRAIQLPGEPLVGTVQATVLADRRAFIAYEIGVPFQQRGFAAEACARLLALLFDDYRVQRVQAEIDSLNLSSIRLMQRLGFIEAGLQREADHFKGRSSDEVRYVLDAPTRAPPHASRPAR
ncbi:GNAT family N-acetyltransferase [Aquincola sp. S2]|uniref:GNAT family N-acetyltransferase n=1 Tax=Pseudaquabacterium terrae TaxID=2732868 RepID=A0ABX2EE58_9BURK|nr:GNAT family protein [Aquabacterium terrae]NRF66910.1 GNAT family N-acetyltransferase [Aquabacterium terrae]